MIKGFKDTNLIYDGRVVPDSEISLHQVVMDVIALTLHDIRHSRSSASQLPHGLPDYADSRGFSIVFDCNERRSWQLAENFL